MGKSSPSAPDYAGAAAQQGTSNVQSAIAQALLNNPTKKTPFGTVKNTQTGTGYVPGFGEVPTFTQETNLDPRAQGAIDNVYSSINRPFDPSNPSAYESAFLKRLEPQLDRARESQIGTLSARGFKPGSTTYDTERELMNQQENDARSQAVTQGLQFDIAARNAPINELTALLSGSQAGVPQFQGAGVGAPNFLGAAQAQGQSMNDIYSTQQAQRSGVINAGAMLGAAYLLSDRRMKKNVSHVGHTLAGHPMYLFHYLWEGDDEERHLGVMADEVPQEWTTTHGGLTFVNYERVI